MFMSLTRRFIWELGEVPTSLCMLSVSFPLRGIVGQSLPFLVPISLHHVLLFSTRTPVLQRHIHHFQLGPSHPSGSRCSAHVRKPTSDQWIIIVVHLRAGAGDQTRGLYARVGGELYGGGGRGCEGHPARCELCSVKYTTAVAMSYGGIYVLNIGDQGSPEDPANRLNLS